MLISKPLPGKKNELSAILEKLENLIEGRGEKELEPHSYHSLKGNLLIILKRREEFKLKKIEDLSIPDIERLTRVILHFQIEDNSLKEKLNRLLDKKFQKTCRRPCADVLKFHNPYRLLCCDSEILYHYIIAKEKLKKLEELKCDKKLVFILKKTYDLEKSNWFEEKYLRPTQNKWVHFVAAIDKLGVLNPGEKEVILKHNAELKINKNLPVLAQIWNRTWLFYGLGIRNIEELRSVFSQREFLEAKKNICGFFPKTLDFEKEDIFAEGTDLMRSKHASVKNFCGRK